MTYESLKKKRPEDFAKIETALEKIPSFSYEGYTVEVINIFRDEIDRAGEAALTFFVENPALEAAYVGSDSAFDFSIPGISETEIRRYYEKREGLEKGELEPESLDRYFREIETIRKKAEKDRRVKAKY